MWRSYRVRKKIGGFEINERIFYLLFFLFLGPNSLSSIFLNSVSLNTLRELETKITESLNIKSPITGVG